MLNLVQGSIPGTTKYISEPEELLQGLAQFQGLNEIYQNILVAIAALKTFFPIIGFTKISVASIGTSNWLNFGISKPN